MTKSGNIKNSLTIFTFMLLLMNLILVCNAKTSTHGIVDSGEEVELTYWLTIYAYYGEPGAENILGNIGSDLTTVVNGGMTIPAFDAELIGMQIGETKHFIVNASDHSYTGQLENQDMYYIVLINAIIDDDPESTITLSAPTLVYPNGGEILNGSVNIVWLASFYNSQSLQVTYSLFYTNNSGTYWNLIANNITKNNYLWDTTSVVNYNNYKIKIIATLDNLTESDLTDDSFTILNAINNNTSSESDSSETSMFTPGITTLVLIIAMTVLFYYQKVTK